MSRRQLLEIQSEDRTPKKWCIPLTEHTFDGFFSHGGGTIHKVFGEGSLFSPLLFGKFFDPSDAFPLWDFDSESLLSGVRSASVSSSSSSSNSNSNIDWFVTDAEYLLKAELPGFKNCGIQIYVDNGKVLEISGRWRQQESNAKDWRSGNWWEFGYARRLELPEDANWMKMEASINDDCFLEIRILKNNSQANDVGPKNAEIV